MVIKPARSPLYIGYRRLPVLAQRSEIYVPAAMPVGLYSD
jgi:hypothetical protein